MQPDSLGSEPSPPDNDKSYAEELEDEAPFEWKVDRRWLRDLIFARHRSNPLLKTAHWRAFARDLDRYEHAKQPLARPETIARIGSRPEKGATTMDLRIIEECGDHGWSYQEWWDHQARLPYRFEAVDLLFEELWTAKYDIRHDKRDATRVSEATQLLPDKVGIRRLRRAIPKPLFALLEKIPRYDLGSREPWKTFLSVRLTGGDAGGPILIMRDLFPGSLGRRPVEIQLSIRRRSA